MGVDTCSAGRFFLASVNNSYLTVYQSGLELSIIHLHPHPLSDLLNLTLSAFDWV